MLVAQHSEYTKYHWIVHFEIASFMPCKLDLSFIRNPLSERKEKVYLTDVSFELNQSGKYKRKINVEYLSSPEGSVEWSKAIIIVVVIKISKKQVATE